MIRKTHLACALLMPVLALGQSQPSSSGRKKPVHTHRAAAPAAAEVEQLRSEIERQNADLQQKIQQLQQQVQTGQQEILALREAAQAQSASQTLTAREASAASRSASSLASAVADLKVHTAALSTTFEKSQAKNQAELAKPAALHYKGVSLTPGGFMAEESVWRQHELQADIASPFNAIPFSGSDLYRLSEFRMSARQTRMSLLAQGNLRSATVSGYLEFDLLGAGLTSNSGESNSYLPRLRHAWIESRWSNWSIDAGQMWTLAESNRKGITPIAGNAYLPDMIDAQYVVGFTWLRQPAVRVVRHIDGRVWIAASAEGAQTSFSARNAPESFLYCSPGTSTLSSTVNYSFDTAPDVVAKIAFEPGFGHYELKGLARFFRDRIYPDAPASAAGAYNNNRLGEGFGAAGSWDFGRKVSASLNALAGHGIGRYGTSQLPDVTVHPDGTLAPILGGQGLATLEFNPTPRWKIYTYDGDEYAGRTSFVNAKGLGVGYGSPLNVNSGCNIEVAPTASTTPATSGCNADTRTVYQTVFGFWYRPYVGEMGRVQYGMEYSWTQRSAWSGVGGAPSTGENMLFTSVRYYLP